MKKSHSDNNFYIKFILGVFIFLSIYYFFNYNIKNFIINNYINIYNKISDLNTKELNTLDFEKQKLENRVFELEQYIKNASDTLAILNIGQTEVVNAKKISTNILPKNIIYSDILLDEGLENGIKVDDLVFVSGFLPIGYVAEVYDNSCKVALFTKDKLETNASIKIDQDHISLKLIGDGAFGFVSQLPSSLDIQVGQDIYTNSSDNFSLGKIINVKNDDSTKEKILYISSNYSNHDGSSFYIQR
jgi:cell shape-determining protein MreC